MSSPPAEFDVRVAGPVARSADAARLAEAVAIAAAVALAVGVVLVSFAYAFLAYPQTDDLERTAAMRFITPAARVWSDYKAIDGRWASLSVQYVLYLGEHVRERYTAMLLTLLATGLFGCCCGVAVVSGRRITAWPVLAGGAMAYAFLWLSAPFGEAFYWFPAAMGYWLPPTLGFVLLWMLRSGTGWWSGIPIAALAFVLPALHEVGGSWVAGVLAVVAAIRWFNRRGGVRPVAIAAVAGVLGIASEVLAPGVARRIDQSPHQSVVDALHHGVEIFASFGTHWTAAVPVLLAVLLVAAGQRRRPGWYAEAPLAIKACLALAIVPLPILVLSAVSYSLGGGIPARLYDGTYFLVAAGFVTFAALCGFDLGSRAGVASLMQRPAAAVLRTVVIALALAGVVLLPRFHAAMTEFQPAMRNRTAMTARVAESWAQSRAGVRNIVVAERMIPLAILPTWFDITEDPKWYANIHCAAYFQVDSIRLAPVAPAKPGG